MADPEFVMEDHPVTLRAEPAGTGIMITLEQDDPARELSFKMDRLEARQLGRWLLNTAPAILRGGR